MGDNTEVKERGCVIVANGRFPSAELPFKGSENDYRL